MKNPPKFLIPAFVLLVIFLIFVAKSAVTIGYGEAGVLFKTFSGGVDTDKTLDEGFHIIAPWNNVTIYNVKQQELLERGMVVLSSNGLAITLDASVLYQPKFKSLGFLHKKRGPNYLEDVIIPAVRSATRSVVGRYTPEQLYSTKRDAIQEEIYEETKAIVEPQYVQLNAILVRDVTLPTAIKEAIERKLRQEQESLEYEFRLTKATKEAQKQIIEAQGKADANRILSASLTDKILRDKGIDATLKLANSPNTKVVIVGGKDGLPLILGNN